MVTGPKQFAVIYLVDLLRVERQRVECWNQQREEEGEKKESCVRKFSAGDLCFSHTTGAPLQTVTKGGDLNLLFIHCRLIDF